MSINDAVGIIGVIVTIYLLWQQNQIFREQNAMAYAQENGLSVAPQFCDLRALAATIAIQEKRPAMNVLELEAFLAEELETRRRSYLPDPDETDAKYIADALDALRCVQRLLGHPEAE